MARQAQYLDAPPYKSMSKDKYIHPDIAISAENQRVLKRLNSGNHHEDRVEICREGPIYAGVRYIRSDGSINCVVRGIWLDDVSKFNKQLKNHLSDKIAASEQKVAAALKRNNKTKDSISSGSLPLELYGVMSKRAAGLVGWKPADEFYTKMGNSSEWVRPPGEWHSRGKSPRSKLVSLLEHLYARYPMPPFVWSLFPGDKHFVAVHLAHGGSLHDLVKDGKGVSAPLTRRMCHDLMNLRGDYTFISAVRKVQIESFRGKPGVHGNLGVLYRALLASDIVQRFNNKDSEEFLFSLVGWLAQIPMLDSSQVVPIVDYAYDCWNRDNTFSMKGRSPTAVLKAMEEWHKRLAQSKGGNAEFKTCGIPNFLYEKKQVQGDGTEIVVKSFRISEILKDKELALEGRKMHHCVYSYRNAIERGTHSIWSLKDDGDRLATIRLFNATRTIVEARGRCNAQITQTARDVIMRWCNTYGISMGDYT